MKDELDEFIDDAYLDIDSTSRYDPAEDSITHASKKRPGCARAAELTREDEDAWRMLGMGPKPPHSHCHSCGAVTRVDDPQGVNADGTRPAQEDRAPTLHHG